MTAPQQRPERRSNLSLRTILLLAATGIVFYAIVSVASVARLGPDMQQFGRQTGSIAEATGSIHRLDSALSDGAHELWLMIDATLNEGTLPNFDATREILLQAGSYTDSTWSLQASSGLGMVTPEVRLGFSQALTAESEAVIELVDAISAYELGWIDRAAESLHRSEQLRNTAILRLHDAERHHAVHMSERGAALTASADRLVRSAVLWGLGGFVLVIFAGIVIYRRVWHPLHHLNHALDRIAEGDLDVQLPAERSDEFGRFEERCNEMILALRTRSEQEHTHTHNLTERLGRTMEASANEIYIFDVKTWRILYVNRAAQENLGYAQEQLAELTPLDLLPELEQAQFSSVLAPLQDGSQTRSVLATKHRRADGTHYPVDMSVELSYAEDPPVYYAITRDMSEHARIERERDLLFEQSPDLLATGTFEGRLTRANSAWGRQLGFTREELLAKPLLSFIHPDDTAVAQGQLRGLREGRTMKGSAIRMRCRDGSFRWISWNVELSADDGVFHATGRDITDLRRAQQRQTELLATISRSSREWKQTFDALDSPVLVVDRKGNVTRANEATRNLVGVTHPELLHLNIDALPPQQLWRQAATMVERAFAEEASVTLQTPSGSGRVWNISVNPVFSDDPQRHAAIVFAHDITRVIELQDSALRNEAMAATGALLAGVAHEVRNPLFSMTATLDAFEARHGVEMAGQHHIQVLRSQMERLRELMRDLLEYGKPPQLNLASASFEQVAHQAIEEAAQIAQEREVRVVTDIEGDVPLIRADHARLVQVYVNLVSNAVQHSPGHSIVVLHAHVTEVESATWLETSVEDSGSGFKPEDLPRLFEPFFTRRRGGTGLGLALVQRIVEQHGGEIDARNRKEGGGMVSVRIPVLHAGGANQPQEIRELRKATEHAS